MSVIGSVHLARAPARLLLVPGVVLALGAFGAGAGYVIGGPIGISLLSGGAIVVGIGLYLGALVLSFRLEVEPGALLLRWLGGHRTYALVRGPVTRVRLRGAGAAPLRRSLTARAWGIGSATLRGEERIEMVGLASASSMILVPTDHGRLAIAATSEEALLGLLASAARVQASASGTSFQAAGSAAPPSVTAPSRPVIADRVVTPQEGRVLTGIERALLEERMAAERAAALAAAEAERQAAEAVGQPTSAPVAAATVSPVVEAVTIPAAAARPRRRLGPRLARPAWLRAPAWMTLPPLAAMVLPVAAPLVTVAVVWVAALVGGHLDGPSPSTRYLMIGLVLSGPLAALGVLIARTWQPRLSGLVAFSAFAAQTLLVRVLIG